MAHFLLLANDEIIERIVAEDLAAAKTALDAQYPNFDVDGGTVEVTSTEYMQTQDPTYDTVIDGTDVTITLKASITAQNALNAQKAAVTVELAAASTFDDQTDLLTYEELKVRGITPASGAPVVPSSP